MNLSDIKSFAEAMAPVVREYVDEATAPLLKRIGELEARPPTVTREEFTALIAAATEAAQQNAMAALNEAVARIPAPEPGKDADPEIVRAMVEAAVAAKPEPVTADQVEEMVKSAVASMPTPKDGESVDPEAVKAMVAEAVAALPPAQDGKSFTAEDAAPLIVEEVARAVAALPAAEPGRDADPEVIRQMVEEAVAAIPAAEPGKDAEPVTDDQIDAAVQRHLEMNPVKTVTADDLAPVVAAQVSEAVAAIPAAKDGQDAAQIAGFVKNHEGVLVVTMTDGRVIETGIRDGAKGDAGRDGLTLTDFDTELSEDGRILTLSLENDEIKVRHELQLATMIYRGVFHADGEYVQGDTVTFGGSLWHCNAATTDKPDSGSEAWTLCAKRGRDGKDAVTK